jgi:mannose PTS system EIIA component
VRREKHRLVVNGDRPTLLGVHIVTHDNRAVMTRLLIVAHAPLASAFLDVARHAFPDAARHVTAVDVNADDALEDIERRIRACLSNAEGTLVLCDTLGATPCNVARLLDDERSRVLWGLNVPMLWRALCYLERLPLEALCENAREGAIAGIDRIPPGGSNEGA